MNDNFVSYKYNDGRCPKCGRPYYYVGDVPDFMIPGTEPWCTCNEVKQETIKGYMTGWVCPICRTVNAPWVAVCHGYHGETTYSSHNTKGW